MIKNENTFTIYSNQKTHDLINAPKEIVKKGKEKRISYEIREPYLDGEMNDNDLSGDDYQDVQDIDTYLEKYLENKNLKFDKNIQYCTAVLLRLTISDHESYVQTANNELKKIIEALKNNQTEFNRLYNYILKYFSKSQISKLNQAYLKKETNFESAENKFKFLLKIVELIAPNSTKEKNIVNENEPQEFLGLDKHVREAVAWKELEYSRSKNKDLSRLAGAIAVKVWLFKEPLLKKYCEFKKIDFNSLKFSQKAKLTKKAMGYYSKDKIAEILDEAVEKELEKRKKTFSPELKTKYKNKRVSIGVELETGIPPFEIATMFSWYENIDRKSAGDSLVFAQTFEQIFEDFAKYKDIQQNMDILEKCELIITKNDKKRKSKEIIEKVKSIINDIENTKVKNSFLDFLEKSKSVSMEFVTFLKKYLDTELQIAKAKYYSFKIKQKYEKRKYDSVAGDEMEGIDENLPDKSHQLMDVFRHHMGQIQSLNHSVNGDAYGEYNLDYFRGNLKNSHRFYLREIWELSKAGFHDLELKDRPLHVTIGWKNDDDKEDDDEENNELIPDDSWEVIRSEIIKKDEYIMLQKEASILNFALLTSGWGNKDFIFKLNQRKNADSKLISDYSDSGRASIIRSRLKRKKNGKFIISAVEFRDFSTNQRDLPRLLQSLEQLGTAMRGFLTLEGNKKNNQKKHNVDKKLHKIWLTFAKKVEDIHDKFDDAPPLYDANSWINNDCSEKVNSYYKKLIEDFNKPDGVVIEMRNLIRKTVAEIEAVFEN